MVIGQRVSLRRCPRPCAACQWMTAAHGARGSQTLASPSLMRSTVCSSRKAGHLGSQSGHPAQITARRTLLWSSRVIRHPGGTSWFPPFRRRSTATNGRFGSYPEVAQFSHLYSTSTTGSGTASLSRTQSFRASAGRGAPTAPGAGSARGSCATGAAAICASSALGFRAARAAAIGAGSAGGIVRGVAVWGGLAAGELQGLGGDQGPQGEVDVVDGQGVVVVGVVRQHLLDAGEAAPHRLDLRLRGLPSPLPLWVVPFALPSPPASGPCPPCPWCPVSPRSPLPLGPLPATGPWLLCAPSRRPPCPCPLPCPVISFAAAPAFAFPVLLPASAAAYAFVVPVRLPPSAAARPLAVPLCLPPSTAACDLPAPGTCPPPLPPVTFPRLRSVRCPVPLRFTPRYARSSPAPRPLP